MPCPCSPAQLGISCALSYVLGSILYVAGSAMFLPAVSHINAGAWSYVAGSVFFVLGGAFNSVKLRSSDKTDSTTWSTHVSYLYVWGSVAFLFGSILFLPCINQGALGAWLFIIGSGLFILAIVLDVSHVYKKHTIRPMWFTLVVYLLNVMGSLVFMFASVPYVLDLSSTTTDTNTVFTIVAILFIFGTACFLSGGTIGLLQACGAGRQNIAQTTTPKVTTQQDADAL